MSLLSGEFNVVLDKLMSKAHVSGYKISNYCHVDEGYVNRLRRGEKHNPSVKVVIKISFALLHYGEKIAISDIAELFEAAGYSFW